MANDLERLKTWMTKSNYNGATLSLELGYSRDWMATIFKGERGIRDSFHRRFYAVFGSVEYMTAFGASAIEMDEPEKWMAQAAVSTAVQRGDLLPAKSYKCRACSNRAVHYHHQSYRLTDHLCVVPLCKSCHYKADRGKLYFP